MLIGSCGALVAIAAEGTALYDSCIPLVVLHEIFETVGFSGISLDALHDTLTADGAVVRNIVVHAGVWLRTEDAPTVHEASLVNIHDVAVAVVEDQMAPAYAVHLARKLQVVIPAVRFSSVEFKNVSAAVATASIDEGVVINVLIAQLSESVSACLMLNHATGIERITIGALRTEGYCRSVLPHLADATIIGRIRNDDNQRLVQIALVYGWSTQSITEYFVVICPQTYATGKGGVESVVADGIHGSHARFRRKWNGGIDVEVITVSLVRLNTEEILHFLLDILQIVSAGNILCIKAVAEQNDVDSTLVALGSLLQGNPFVLAVFIAILRNVALVGVVFVLQSEHHLSITAISILGHSLDG